MEMVCGMVTNKRLGILRPHQAVQTVVHGSPQSFDLFKGLQKQFPLLEEIAHFRFDGPNGLQGPHVPWGAP